MISRTYFLIRNHFPPNFVFYGSHGSTVWKNEKFSLTEKIFREINFLGTSLAKPLISRNFCYKTVAVKRNFHTVYPQCGKTRNSLSLKKNIVKSTV